MIAVSLSTVMVANNTKKALLIDCDLRKPRIHKIFHCSSDRPGLASLLEEGTNGVAVEDVIQSHDIRGLYYITAGPVPEDPVSLLASKRFESILDRLKRSFDYIILDTPPLLLFPDARILTRLADGAVVVARQGLVKQNEFHEATSLMQSTNGGKILGIVLNRTRRKGIGYRGYGGYYYYRHYDYYGRS